MKIRQGFVSNSSSSSFVVAFPKKPKSIDEVQNILFPGKRILTQYDNDVTTYDAAEIIFEDIRNQKPNKAKEIARAMEGWHHDGPKANDLKYKTKELSDFGGPTNFKTDYDKFEKDWMKFIKLKAKEFRDKHSHEYIYTFQYSDNDGDTMSILEHGDTFKELPHIKISRH